jgi:YD repeat-containing protein
VLPNSTVLAYDYDADGRRIRQDVSGTKTNYLWDEFFPYGDVVLEYGTSGTPIVDYTLAGGQLLSQTRSGATNFYLPDVQGSVRGLAGNF